MTGAALAQNFVIWRSYLREVADAQPSTRTGRQRGGERSYDVSPAG
jgi:hypothetical protein